MICRKAILFPFLLIHLAVSGGPADTLKLVRGNEGTAFFDSLQERASRNRWTHRLHNIVIREPRELLLEDTVHTRLSTEPYESFAGMVIRKILLVKLDPFGTSLYNSAPRPVTRL